MALLFLLFILPGVPYRVEAGQMDIVLRGGDRVMHMSGGVRISTEDATISSMRGEYIEERKFALLLDSVRMDGEGFVVRSDTLKYWMGSDRMVFSGRVRAEDETRSLETHVLEFCREEGSLLGDVRIAFKKKDTWFHGSAGTYDLGDEEARLFGHPEALILRGDTLYVQADTFRFHGDTVFGGPNVVFEMEGTEGGGEFLTFVGDVGTLRGKGWMRWDGGSAQGDTLWFTVDEEGMREVTFSGDVRLETESEEGTLTLEGPWMRASIVGGRLSNLEALWLERGVYTERTQEEP